MTNLCRRLDWDSQFFGYHIGRVDADRLSLDVLAHIEAWCAAEGNECLYFLADAAHAPTAWLAHKGGFIYVDTRVTLSTALAAPIEMPESIRLAVPADSDPLKRIAGSSHRDSRFYFDPVFPVKRCDALFETWIERSLDGSFAHAVLVARDAGQPVGYMAVDEKDGRGKINLVGIDERARGKGLGTLLVRAALAWFWERDLRQVDVVTQARNVSAQRLYGKGGFLPVNVQTWYHRWSPAILETQGKGQ